MYKAFQETWSNMISEGSPFEIKEIEVRGEMIRAYALAPPSLREVWLSSLQFADRDYLVYQEERWTYAEAHKNVAAIACWLRSNKVDPGDRVAISMRNYPEWLMCYWACVSQGIAVVGMNAWWVGAEMKFGLEDSTPKVLICDQERLARFNEIKDAFPELTIVGVRLQEPVEGVIPFSELIETGGDMPEAIVDPDSDACIFYTSGTTGLPKGAQLTHRGCVNNIMNLAFSGTIFPLASAIAKNEAPPNPEDAPIGSALVTTPLFHVTANNCLAHGTTLAGGKLVHMYRWNALDALQIIEREKITNMTGVPVMSRELIAHPDFDKYDTSTLLSVGGGGAQLQADLVAKIDKKVKNARPSTGYGMTETCGIITSISGDFFIDKPDSCGPAMPNIEAKCVDANGKEVAQGEVGELIIKGAPIIKGYLNREDATKESIVNAWFATGDVARIDEHGFIFLVDRVKDMVLRGGENIYCAEVETVLFAMDGIAECTVFGVDDERLGEEVGAAIVLEPASSLSADEIRSYCLENMARPKVPRYIWIQEEALPRNANGKFLKRELKENLDTADAR